MSYRKLFESSMAQGDIDTQDVSNVLLKVAGAISQ